MPRATSMGYKNAIKIMNRLRSWNKDPEVGEYLDMALKGIISNAHTQADGRVYGRGSYYPTRHPRKTHQ